MDCPGESLYKATCVASGCILAWEPAGCLWRSLFVVPESGLFVVWVSGSYSGFPPSGPHFHCLGPSHLGLALVRRRF